MMARRKRWWLLAAGTVIVAGATSVGAFVWQSERQADAALPVANTALVSPVSPGQDARGVRFGLLGALGLALAGGAVTQCRALSGQRNASERPAWPETEKTAAPDVDLGASAPPPLPVPGGAVTPLWPGVPAPALVDNRAAAGWTPALSSAQAQCARAIEAAHGYNRSGTIAGFTAALAADPDVKPTTLPGFWEMPSGGHADLARAYLRFGRRLDARSVLAIATMAFGPNRELDLLQRELAEDSWWTADRSA